jgi:hypothetical protein
VGASRCRFYSTGFDRTYLAPCGATVPNETVSYLEIVVEELGIAIDIAKKVFQLHGIDPVTGCSEQL